MSGVQFFLPGTEDLPRRISETLEDLRVAIRKELDSAYLSGIIDEKGISIRPGRDGKPSAVEISFGSSRHDAPSFFNEVDRLFGVEGARTTADLAATPYFETMAEQFQNPHKEPTFYWKLSDPASVLKIAQAVLLHSQRKERIQGLIEACQYLLSNQAPT